METLRAIRIQMRGTSHRACFLANAFTWEKSTEMASSVGLPCCWCARGEWAFSERGCSFGDLPCMERGVLFFLKNLVIESLILEKSITSSSLLSVLLFGSSVIKPPCGGLER